MKVIENQAFNACIMFPCFHGGPDCREVLLMNHFVGLDVKGPGAVGRNCVKSFVGLNGQHLAAFPQRIIPGCVDDSDFRISDRKDEVPRVIV